MRRPRHSGSAAKRSLSVRLKSDLHDKARGRGRNVSAIAEAALAEAVRDGVAERIGADVRQELA